MAKINSNVLIGETGKTLAQLLTDDSDIRELIEEKTTLKKSTLSDYKITTAPLGFSVTNYYYSSSSPIVIDGNTYKANNTLVVALSMKASDLIVMQIGVITYSASAEIRGKIVYRYKHGDFGSMDDWITHN